MSVKRTILLYTAIILLLAALPINGKESVLNDTFILSFRLDYLVHFGIFIPWMFLAWLYAKISFSTAWPKALGWITAGLALAVISEILQYFLPYRSFNINDLLANCVGVLLGSLFFLFPHRSHKIVR